MRVRGFLLRIIVAAASLCLYVSAGLSQQFPSKPVRLLIPVAPGGGGDIFARSVGKAFSERNAAPLVIENRPDANFTLAANGCAKAKPDGYTICLLLRDNVSISSFVEKMQYNVMTDFAPIGLLVYLQNVIVANASTPFNTFQEMVAYSRNHPDKINYTAFGASVAILAWLTRESGARMTYILYKGGPEATLAFLNNTIQVMYLAVGNPGVVADVNSGRMKGLAVPGDKRNPLMPGVPSFSEIGLPKFATKSWLGIFAPAGTPKDALAKLSSELAAIVLTPEFRDQQVTPFGFEAVGSAPEEFARFIVEDRKAGTELAKLAGPRQP